MPGILSAFPFSWSSDPSTVGRGRLMFWEGARPPRGAAGGRGACGRRPEAEPWLPASITWDDLGCIEWVQNITWALNCGRGRQGRGSARWEPEQGSLVLKGKGLHARTRKRTRGNEGGCQVMVSKESETSALQPPGPAFRPHLTERGDGLPRAHLDVNPGVLLRTSGPRTQNWCARVVLSH